MIDPSKNTTVRGVANQTVGMSYTERVIWGCFLAIINIVSLLGNSAIIFVILKRSQFRNRKFTFLLVLIISDFVIAIVMMPLYLVNLFVENFFENSNHTCAVIATLFTILPIFSYLCITSLAIEKYIMLKYPIKHRVCYTNVVATGIVLAKMLLSAMAAVINLLRSTPTYKKRLRVCFFDQHDGNEQEVHNDAIITLVSLGILHLIFLYCSTGIVVVIWKRKNSLKQISPRVQDDSATSTNRQTLNLHSREIMSTIRILIVTFVVLGCSLPSTICFACELLGFYWPERSIMASTFIFYCKSILNPFISAFFHTQFRYYLLKTLRCKA